MSWGKKKNHLVPDSTGPYKTLRSPNIDINTNIKWLYSAKYNQETKHSINYINSERLG